jgi:hypothetical protein
MRRLAPTAAAIGLIALAPAAQARPHDLWTTVNLCNGGSQASEMGVRGRMPGDGTRAKMYMRFTAQYRDTDGTWKSIGGQARSPWIYAGSALFTHQEAGWTFSLDPPEAGDHFVFRGLTEFEWRARRKHHDHKASVEIVRTERLRTEAGHPSDDSQPAGYSAASCQMDGPAG